MRAGGLFLGAAAALLAGCDSPARVIPATPASAQTQAAEPGPIRFVSAGDEAGIDFRLGHQGRSPLTILETAGGGCAFFDFDQDGWPDVILAGPQRAALYRNRGDGTFEDVTRKSGIRSDRYWMGCAVGDYDGDGRPDLFLTGYRCSTLYRNQGGGRFADATREAGITGLDWTLSAAFADINGDGRLDLYVPQYLKFDETTQQICQAGGVKFACGPELYKPLQGKLLLNAGGGRFRALPPEELRDTGKTWGVVVSDLLESGKPAIYLANDMMPCDLWTQEGKRWKNVGPLTGTAYDIQGHMQGAMGVDTGDYDNDGRLDLIVTTFFAQETSLYRNDGNGLFTVTSGPTGIGPATMPYVGFGTAFADLDNDGWLDVVIANGHVRDSVEQFDTQQSYRQPLQLFRNDGRRFVECTASAGEAVRSPLVGRGLSYADYDRDGRLDLLVVDLEGKALLLRNQSPARQWLSVRLRMPGENRFALGARIELQAGDQKQTREVKTSGSVLSGLDTAAHFGLGDHEGPVQLRIRWPDGTVRTQYVTELNRSLEVSR
ncbi:MAG: CRTAC1 family protein [Armatimonadota bacterium]